MTDPSRRKDQTNLHFTRKTKLEDQTGSNRSRSLCAANSGPFVLTLLLSSLELNDSAGVRLLFDQDVGNRFSGNTTDPSLKGINMMDVIRCQVVARLVSELFYLACDRELPQGAARRRPRCHIRQISMYISHVVLSIPYRTISAVFSKDRTTVVHACSVIEDRRENEDYDRFVVQCERCVSAVFLPIGANHEEQ